MNSRDGFSLVEVVIAIGVFVAGVVGAIALLSTTTDSASATLNGNGAIRVAESTEALLRETAWDSVVGLLQENAPAPIYADKNGASIGVIDTVDLSDAFYEIELRRLPDFSPIADDASAGFLAIELRVSWPVRQEDNAIVPVENRERLVLNLAINR
jgi:uncharacterized protein (TIGR02598 family)